MPRIFISYRRAADTDMAAGRLRDALARHFGAPQIFRDRETIQAGDDWKEQVRTALTGDTIVLVLIGPRWVTDTDAQGRRLIDLPEAAHRVEIERALQQKLRIVPVLIGTASMPKAADLPPGLRKLATLNAVPIRDGDWNADVRRLITTLERAGVECAPGDSTRFCRLTFDGPLEKAMVIFEELANRFPNFRLTLERVERGSVVLVLSGSESGIEQLRRLFESQHGMEIHGYRLIGFATIPAPRPTPEPAGDRTRGWRRWIGAIDAPAWGVQAILSRHFVPAGVMGMDYSAPLTLDLRRHARRHAWLCATLGAGLVAALAGLIVVMIGDAGGEHPRAIGLALAGFAILAMFGIRYAAREWSQASVLARLADRVEAPFLLSIVESLIGSHRPRRPGRRTGSLGSRKAVQQAQRSEADR